MMKWTRFAVLLGLFFLAAPILTAQEEIPRTLNPVHKFDIDWWKNFYDADCARIAEGNVDFILIGDSITEIWDRAPEVLDYYYGDRNYVNLGIGGDETQHLLWRLDNMPMDKIHPKAAMLLIGINSLWGEWENCSWNVALGTKAVVDKLKALYPDIKILVLQIFPVRPTAEDLVRWRAEKANAYVMDLLKDYPNVTIKNINYIWVNQNGEMSKELMDDFVHPTAEGYKRWGAAVEPIIAEMLGVHAKPAME